MTAQPSAWVPIEWPAEWNDPARLSLLDGTPFNCVLAPLAMRDAAAKRGLAAPDIAWRSWKEVNWRAPGDVVAINDAFWPELQRKSDSGQDAGPTGAPWLDANGWLILYARSRAAGAPVWIKSPPPEETPTPRTEQLLLAASEACAFGALRPAWLPSDLASGVASGNSAALATWRRIWQHAAWHEARSAMRHWPVASSLLLVSDFTGPNEFLSSETMLLAARRNLLFQPVETSRLTAKDLSGRKAVLYVDRQPPALAQKKLLEQFAGQGGLLIAQKSPGFAPGKPLPGRHPRFEIAAAGKGRIALARSEFDDPWVLAQDTHLLMSRRWDPVRLFNPGSLIIHYTVAPGGARGAVHLLNYTLQPVSHDVIVQIAAPCKAARFLIPGRPQPLAASIERVSGRQEIRVAAFSVYLAVELELTRDA
jgi:hypothetical protein